MKTKIAYVINHSAFFYSHIFPIAKVVRKKNYKIELFCGLASSKEMNIHANKKLRKNNVKISESLFRSSGVNILNEIRGLIQLIKSLKKYKPDIIHCATPKGILFGGLAALYLDVKSLLIFNSGMGFLFSNKLNFFYKIIKLTYMITLKTFVMKHKNKMIIVENKDDYNFLKKEYKLKTKELTFIKGSGIDLKKYKYIKKNNSKIVLLPARIVKEKGIEEFIIAAKSLKKKYPNWKFLIAGTIDYQKKSKYNIDKLNLLNDNNQVTFLGYVRNMINIYNKTAIVCLPSYREGFSKTLQEAAAKGLPIVTTNVVGCKDAIISNYTGLLCKARSSKSLEAKLKILITNKKKRLKFGYNARKLAEKEFSIKNVINKNYFIYDKLIQNEK